MREQCSLQSQGIPTFYKKKTVYIIWGRHMKNWSLSKLVSPKKKRKKCFRP